MKIIKLLPYMGLFYSFSLLAAEGPICYYGASLESIRLTKDYDPIWGASDLCLRVLFAPEGAEPISLFDRRSFLHQCIDIADDQLGQFVELPNNGIEAFEKGSGKIQVSLFDR